MKAHALLCTAALAACALLSGCESETSGPDGNSGPWVGSWVQVNFLATDDNGVWDDDDLSGIGFVAEVTETEWVLTDEYGQGCSITFSYSVDRSNRYSLQATELGAGCPPYPLELLKGSGRLEFSSDGRFMIEHFDPMPGDDIVAFKWMRR